MQGFNMGRYRPYDADPSKESFNSRSGKHPLGKRARKLDQGVLIVRFELPFNIWCGGCEGHIGQGVRYNAEKTRVGEYYSTPIFRFRCKTACCQHWFEIETDPKNTRYVVVSGARQQNKDWDPAEYGGHAIQDDGTGGPSSIAKDLSEPVDAFSALEKSNADKTRSEMLKTRMEELEAAVTARSADPYTLNSRLRQHFREGKKERLRIEAQDEVLRKRIGWNDDRKLVSSADFMTPRPGLTPNTNLKRAWTEAKDEHARVGHVAGGTSRRTARSLPTASKASSRSGTSRPASDLATRVIAASRAKADPFALPKR